MTTEVIPQADADATPVTRLGLNVSEGGWDVLTGDDKFANNGKQYLLFQNSSGGAIVVTIVTPTNKQPSDNVGALTVADPTVSVPDGASLLVGPFKPSIYNDADGFVQITCSPDPDFTCLVVQMNNYSPKD